jgi:hypothetical protein
MSMYFVIVCRGRKREVVASVPGDCRDIAGALFDRWANEDPGITRVMLKKGARVVRDTCRKPPAVRRKPAKPTKPHGFCEDRYLVCAPSDGLTGYRPIAYRDTLADARRLCRSLARFDKNRGLTPLAYFVRDLVNRVDVR